MKTKLIYLLIIVLITIYCFNGKSYAKKSKRKYHTSLTTKKQDSKKKQDLNETKRPDIDVSDFFKYSLAQKLIEAALKGKTNRIKQLINDGLNINTQGLHGITPLMFVLLNGNIEGVNVLLESGADPDVKDDEGDTAVTIAAGLKYSRFLENLLVKGGNANEKTPGLATTLMIASAAGFIENVRLVINANVDINARDMTGNTALTYAIYGKQTDIISLLLENGATKLIINNNGMSALDIINALDIPSDEKKRYEELLQIKAADIFDDANTLELAKAAAFGDTARIIQLVNSGADVNAQGLGGVTPIVWALDKGNFEGFKALLKNHANPNIKNDNGLSPIFIAATLDDNRFLEESLANGGNIQTKGPGGSTLLMAAVQQRKDQNVNLLIKNNINLDDQDSFGLTTLHYAVIGNNEQFVQVLLNSGAKRNIYDNEGLTPFDYVKANHNGRILNLLTSK